MKSARFEDVKADVLILETTRGNRELRPGFSRSAEIKRLSEAMHRVLHRRGSLLIPAFALGRTQEILALLAIMTREGHLKPQPIYIGGLGRVFTEIYDLEAHRTHRQYPNLQLHDALNLVVLDQERWLDTLKGTVKNFSKQHARDVTVVVKFLDRKRKPLGVQRVSVGDLGSGEQSSFSLPIEERNRTAKHYEFNVLAIWP